MKNERFHIEPEGYRKYEQRSIKKALDNGVITPRDADLIRQFAAETTIENNLSPQRRFKLVSNLITSHRFLPSVGNLTLVTYYDAIDSLKNGKKPDGKPYTQNTIADLVRFTKRYLLWLSENKFIDIPGEKLKKIKTPRPDLATKTEEDILTIEEVRNIIDKAKSTRYKALLGVLYEGGLRSAEIGSLQWKDITFNSYGARIKTSGKTGKPRNVPIISYCAHLATWKSVYPGDASGENFVFLNQHNRPLQYRALSKSIQKFAREAGIDKKVTPHIFRHSRITHSLQGGMQETIAKEIFWGNKGTNMITVYAHLTNTDADREAARLAGVELPDISPISKALDPVQCPRCTHVNPPGTEHCGKCGLPLTDRAQATYEAAVSTIEQMLSIEGGPTLFFEALARMRENGDHPNRELII